MVQVTRFFTTLSFLLVASSAVHASVAPRDGVCPGSEICGSYDPSYINNVLAASSPPSSNAPTKRITNAERLARGLPLMKPTRRFQPTRISRSYPSGAPETNYRGVIKVYSDSDNSVLGYISKNSFNHQQLRYQSSPGDALVVDFSTPQGAIVTSQIEITTENSDLGYNLLSLVQGRESTDSTIQNGNFNYGYIAGSAHTEPGATPQSVPNSYAAGRTAESSAWTFDATSGALSPQWINPDGGAPTTYNFVQSTALYFGGDPAAFGARFPAAVTHVHYVFEAL